MSARWLPPFALLALARAAPVVTWASSPVLPGETLLLAGHDFDGSCVATFSTTSAAVPATTLAASAVAGHATPSSLKFIVPAALPAA